MIKPIILYTHDPTPNPLKVVILLEELGVPWEKKHLMFGREKLKGEPCISINPNGRMPSIEDPNTGIRLFESGAIIEYVIQIYDTDNKLHYTTLPEKYLTQSWLHFQSSGQRPYLGQRAWFTTLHLDEVKSAPDRYANKIKRVTNVINAHLKKQGNGCLVGDKITYADLAFIPWFNMMKLPVLVPGWDYQSECPHFAAWFQSLLTRDGVERALANEEFARPLSGPAIRQAYGIKETSNGWWLNLDM